MALPDPITVRFLFERGTLQGRVEYATSEELTLLDQVLEVKLRREESLGHALRTAAADTNLPTFVRDCLERDQFYFELFTAENNKFVEIRSQHTVSIPYAIHNHSDTVYRLDEFRGHSTRNLSVGDLQRTINAGLLNGDPTKLVVQIPWGRGGDSGPFVDIVGFLLTHSVDIGIGTIIGTWLQRGWDTLTSRIRNGSRDKRARRVAAAWEARGIRYPRELREFLDYKHKWSVIEVAKRLEIPGSVAQQLLTALGYQQDSQNEWIPGTSRRSRRARRRWLNREEDFDA